MSQLKFFGPVIAIFLMSQMAHAAFIEIGASGSYKKSNIDVGAYDEASSLTGSVAYIFDEMSALELSYTNGYSKRVVPSNLAGYDHATTLFYEMVGLDLVITFGGQESFLRPYVKAGAGYIMRKRLVDQYQNLPASILDQPTGAVPSAGFGLKLSLTKSLSLKAGVEAWTSRPLVGGQTNPDLDVSARAGLSWLF
jgi:outer membrane protein W